MKIEFELTEKQVLVLKELMAIPGNEGKSENEVCRLLTVQCLVNIKQQLVAKEIAQ